MKVNVVNGFSDHPIGGNPAGVVYLSKEPYPDKQSALSEDTDSGRIHLSVDQMQKIAAKLHFSETAFIRRLSDRKFSIRYFTPAAEVPLCGHATIASFAYLYQTGVLDDGVYELVTEEAELPVEVSEGIIWMEMDHPKLEQQLDEKNVERICRAYGFTSNVLDDALEVRIVKSGLRDIHMCVKSRESLLRAVQDENEIRKISEELGVVGVHMSCLNLQNNNENNTEHKIIRVDSGAIPEQKIREPIGRDAEKITAYCSNFAPLYEIPEECATGTSNGGLTWYLYQKGLIQENQMNCFLQGEHMNRPSKIYTKVKTEHGNPTVWVGGSGVICEQDRIIKI